MEPRKVLANHVHERIVNLGNPFGRLRGLRRGLAVQRQSLHLAVPDFDERLARLELLHAESDLPVCIVDTACAVECVDVLAGIFGPHRVHVDYGLPVVLREHTADGIHLAFLFQRKLLQAGIHLEIMLPAVHIAVHVVVVHAHVELLAATHQNFDTLREFLQGIFRIAASLLERPFRIPRAEPLVIPGNGTIREHDHFRTRLLGARDSGLHRLEIFFRLSRNHVHLRYINLHGKPLIYSIQS